MPNDTPCPETTEADLRALLLEALEDLESDARASNPADMRERYSHIQRNYDHAMDLPRRIRAALGMEPDSDE